MDKFKKIDRLLADFAKAHPERDLSHVRRKVLTSVDELVTNPRDSRYKRGYISFNLFGRTNMGVVLALILTAFLGVGGVASASNASVPGDALYSMDLLAEKFQANFQTSEEAKFQFNAKLTEERMAELKTLKEKSSQLTDEEKQAKLAELQAKLVARLEAQSDRLNEVAEKLRAKAETKTDAEAKAALEKIATRMEAIAAARAELAAKIEADTTLTKPELKALFKEFRQKVELSEEGLKFRIQHRMKPNDNGKSEERAEFKAKVEGGAAVRAEWKDIVKDLNDDRKGDHQGDDDEEDEDDDDGETSILPAYPTKDCEVTTDRNEQSLNPLC